MAKERPIIFSGSMVRAILDGRKTQTRRVIKNIVEGSGGWPSFSKGRHHGNMVKPKYCPYGLPGDRLWVRETYAIHQTVDHIRRPDGRAFSEVSDGCAAYRADGHDTVEDLRSHIKVMGDMSLEAIEIQGDRWRPSIHMPRWASRITLEVTDVRVERVQEIETSPEDMLAEGVTAVTEAAVHLAFEFRKLWDSINAKRGFGWDVNPWVWVVSFKVLDA